MKDIFNNAISSELFFVYALIALVIILIAVIIIIDKKESKKKPKNLFDTLNMKIIADPYDKETKRENETEELIIDQKEQEKNDFQDLQSIEEVKIKELNNTLRETINEIKNETCEESELDKTQAQIRVEEITKALKEAQKEEIEEDKYQKFEEEQEKNAIISYSELKKSFDHLYSESEKTQYLEDDEIPINIDELYELRDNQRKVKLEDFDSISKSSNQPVSNFKSSPLISPVYGIQKPPIENSKPNPVDSDIENANIFLKNLKELKNNLE